MIQQRDRVGVPRVDQKRSDVVAGLAHHAVRVNGDPAAVLRPEQVLRVQVSVQHPGLDGVTQQPVQRLTRGPTTRRGSGATAASSSKAAHSWRTVGSPHHGGTGTHSASSVAATAASSSSSGRFPPETSAPSPTVDR